MQEDRRTNVLTTLHKTTTLLPRILPSGKSTSDGVPERESLPFWEEVLRKVYDDLTLAPDKREKDRVRVVVYGVDGTPGANELVTALLQDPFVSDEQRAALRTRWDSQPEGSRVVKIQYGTSPSEDEDVVHVQSSWLQRFGVPIEVTEFNTPSTEDSKALFNADVPIIVCNPVSTSLQSMFPALSTPSLPISHENTILAIIAPPSSDGTTSTLDSQATRFRAQEGLRLLFVDPARALHGLEVLADGSASSLSVQRYQDDSTGSNVASVTNAVKDILSSVPSGSVAAVHAQTGRALVKEALSTADFVLRRAQLEADAVLKATSELRSEMEEAKAKAHLEVFGAGGKDGDEIAKAVAHAKRSVQPTMDALQWYKLFWRVDDVREAVTAAVDRAWCRDLERKLVFHAGRLASLQTGFTRSADDLARSFPPSAPYHSPVLLNSLARIASSPSYALTPAALTAPLHARQAQLGYPTSRLHASAQRAVLGMSGSVLGGLGVAWAGWATELQLLGGVIDVGMGTETAVGAGMLGATLGVRWAVGRWDRAKRKWWKDWDRVGEGLERDLKAALAETMDTRVVAVSEEACSGLEDIVAERKLRIEELKDEVKALRTELDGQVSPRPSPTTRT
uniref:Tryptophan synthase (EC) n=1 Tax=Ganoderma boninense TaxID=34458 RepID=A0A5K1K059_9APHY|nr:Tryptophan synthase (EC [Ganoderma boninense]